MYVSDIRIAVCPFCGAGQSYDFNDPHEAKTAENFRHQPGRCNGNRPMTAGELGDEQHVKK